MSDIKKGECVMKKFFSTFFVILILAVVVGAIVGLVGDNMNAQGIENELKSINFPTGTTVVSSTSSVGRLTVPNGPLQFYGGVLLQSNESAGELLSLIQAKYNGDLDYKLIPLANAPAEFGTDFPSELRFGYHDSAPKGYYLLYAFGEGQDPLPYLDYRFYF